MKKFVKTFIAIVVILILTLNYTIVFAETSEKTVGEMSNTNGGTPPDKPDGNGGAHGGNDGNSGSSNVSHKGATEISADTSKDGVSYSSSLNNEVSDNSNINLNGHTLYVNGSAITSTNYKGASQNNTTEKTSSEQNVMLPIALTLVIMIIIIIIKIKIRR